MYMYIYTFVHMCIYIYIYKKEVQAWSSLPQWLVLPWERELARFRKIKYCSFYSPQTEFWLSL